MDEQIASTDAVIARIASVQHGVVEVGQLRAAGISKDSVWKAVQAGRLHRVFRGVYAVGHPGLSGKGRWMAAVLACGEGRFSATEAQLSSGGFFLAAALQWT